jgi:hypothetical protein
MEILYDKSIDEYLAFADERTRAFLQAPPRMFEAVRAVDALGCAVFRAGLDIHPMAVFLALNGHYLFSAAVRTAISGHVTCVYPIVRSGLESACYGFLISKDESLSKVWSNRDKGEEERAECRRVFTSAVKDTVKRLRPIQVEMADYVNGLYQQAITSGAHPNQQSVFPHIEAQDEEGGLRVSFTAMYAETSREVQTALLACSEYGLGILYLIAHMNRSSEKDLTALNEKFQDVVDLNTALSEKLSNGELD